MDQSLLSPAERELRAQIVLEWDKVHLRTVAVDTQPDRAAELRELIRQQEEELDAELATAEQAEREFLARFGAAQNGRLFCPYCGGDAEQQTSWGWWIIAGEDIDLARCFCADCRLHFAVSPPREAKYLMPDEEDTDAA